MIPANHANDAKIPIFLFLHSGFFILHSAYVILPSIVMLYPDLLQRLCRARDLLRDWSDGPQPVSAVARETGLTRYHFIRLFKAVFGETPHQYRSRAQIEQAKHLLVLTEWSVTEVCMAVGFSSLGSFSTLFARRVGTSPSAFQRRHRPASTGLRRLPSCLIPGCLTLMTGVSGEKSTFREARRARK